MEIKSEFTEHKSSNKERIALAIIVFVIGSFFWPFVKDAITEKPKNKYYNRAEIKSAALKAGLIAGGYHFLIGGVSVGILLYGRKKKTRSGSNNSGSTINSSKPTISTSTSLKSESNTTNFDITTHATPASDNCILRPSPSKLKTATITRNIQPASSYTPEVNDNMDDQTQSTDEKLELKCLSQAQEEIDSINPDKGIWAKAMLEAKGDKDQQEYHYLKLRSDYLLRTRIAELKAEEEARILEEKRIAKEQQDREKIAREKAKEEAALLKKKNIEELALIFNINEQIASELYTKLTPHNLLERAIESNTYDRYNYRKKYQAMKTPALREQVLKNASEVDLDYFFALAEFEKRINIEAEKVTQFNRKTTKVGQLFEVDEKTAREILQDINIRPLLKDVDALNLADRKKYINSYRQANDQYLGEDYIKQLFEGKLDYAFARAERLKRVSGIKSSQDQYLCLRCNSKFESNNMYCTLCETGEFVDSQ